MHGSERGRAPLTERPRVVLTSTRNQDILCIKGVTGGGIHASAAEQPGFKAVEIVDTRGDA